MHAIISKIRFGVNKKPYMQSDMTASIVQKHARNMRTIFRQLSHPSDENEQDLVQVDSSPKRMPHIQIKPKLAKLINQDLELRRQIEQTCGCPLWELPGDYRQHEIGSGNFARVHVIKHPSKNDVKVVAKVIQGNTKSSTTKSLFVKEMKIGTGVQHPNVVRFLAYWDCPLVVYLEYVAFDWSEYGLSGVKSHDLVNFLSTMHEGGVVESFHTDTDIFTTIVSDIASGLGYLHDSAIAHRDLKPLNILVSNSQTDILPGEERLVVCKITDFGESRSYFAQTTAITSTSNTNKLERGTTPFMSPEVLNQDYNSQNIVELKHIDVWAFGMIVFCILNPDVEHPFSKEHMKAETETGASSLNQDKFKVMMRNAFMQGKVPPKGSDDYEYLGQEMPMIDKIMRRCLNNAPEKRPTMKDVMECLKAPEVIKGSIEIPTIANEVTAVQPALSDSPSSLRLRKGSVSHMNAIEDRRISVHDEEVMSTLKEIRNNTKTLLARSQTESQSSFGSPAREGSWVQPTDTLVAQVSDDLSHFSVGNSSPPRPKFQLGEVKPHQEVIQKNWRIFRDTLEPWSVVTELFTRGHLSHTDKELVAAEKSRHQKVEKLLNIMYANDGEVYAEFLKCLPLTNQTHLAERVANEDTTGTPEHITLLTRSHTSLLHDLCDVTHIADFLFSSKLISQVQMEDIRARGTETQKAEVLLDAVRTFSPEGFKEFTNVLDHTGNDHLSAQLR